MIFTRRLGVGALALGLAAPFAGSPYRSQRGALDLDAITRAIEDGADHVSARELATWIRARRPGLRVIDVRSPEAFQDDAIPTAENLPVRRLAGATFAPEQKIVLYSQEGAHAGQAWVLLRALGVTDAVFIPGGLADWRDEVMHPVLSPDLSASARAEIVELSHFFNGSPRLRAPETLETGVARGRPSLRRRGC
jgi:rhodanese-related sulfurtransferase